MVGRQTDALTLPDGEMRGGQVLGGRYRLDECLETFGEIAHWAGWDETLSRAVSIYIAPPNHPATDALLGSARRAAVAIDPRFLRVLDAMPYGPSEPVTFVVCENLAGVTLQQLLQRGPLPGLDAAWVVAELASALAPMHEIGLGHGVLNPANVLVTATGKVRIGGFLLLAVLMGDRLTDPKTTEREDVLALGRLLYAMSTGTWPQDLSSDPSETYGLPPAQRRDDELAPASAVRAGLPPGLDAVCMQTLQPRPDAAPLRSATAIAVALRRVLGTVDASQDLASRVSDYVNGVVRDESESGQSTNDVLGGVRLPADADADIATTTIEEPTRVASVRTSPGVQTPASRPTPSGEPSKPVPAPPGWTAVDPGLPRAPRMVWANRHLPRWWPAALLVAGIVIISIMIALITKSCGGGASTSTPTASPEAVAVVNVTVFDPVADGGDTRENDEQLPSITDGNPATCWTTETYGAGYLPGKKPGIGLMLDFGAATSIRTLTLTVASTPMDLSVMVPQGDAAQTDTAPMTSVTDWSRVMGATIDTVPQTLTLPDKTTSRFVLLYFTKLPPFPLQANYTQGGVCEVSVTGNAVH